MTDRPLRFCMVTTFYPPYSLGGDGIFVWRLANALARRGHRVDVIHCADAFRLVAGQEPSGTAENHPNVTVHTLRSPFGWLSPLATQQLGRPLLKEQQIREILDRGFDVIHYHNISLVGGPGVLSLGRGLKLYTMHEHWLVCPTHILFKFNRAPCTEKSCLLCTLSHKRPPQWWRYGGLLPSALENVDALLALSRYAADAHHTLAASAPLVHLPGFVPDVSSGPEPSDEPAESEPYFLFAGRLEKLKGLHTIIPLFLRQRRAFLAVAGAGNDERALRELAGGSDRVRFLGHVALPRLQALYRNAVALIVPSLCPEIFPLVILEAFQQQTPVLARNLGGMPELIQESGGGLICDTAEEWDAAMRRLLDGPAERRERGQRGFDAYRREWREEVHLRRYLSLIENLAPRSRSRHEEKSCSAH